MFYGYGYRPFAKWGPVNHRSFTKVQRRPAEASNREARTRGLMATFCVFVAEKTQKMVQLWPEKPIITGDFYGIIHSISGVL